MKCAVLLSTLLMALVPLCLADTCSMNPADMDNGVRQSMVTYEDFFNATVNETDPACYHMGCCPRIVVYPRSKGSVIQPFTGYRGNVAIIVDYGRDSNPCNPYRRRCTNDDTPFVWYVNWGDGTSSHGYQKTIGPFQVAHQYAKYCDSYGIQVFYCSDTGHCPHRRCCDSLYRVIDVSFDPKNPHPDIKFEQF